MLATLRRANLLTFRKNCERFQSQAQSGNHGGHVPEEAITIDTPDGPMNAFLARPDGAGPNPALLVAQEAFGVNSHIKNVCRRLAEKGYVALAPELFHRDGPGIELPYDDFPRVMPYLARLTNAGLLVDLGAALKQLRSHAAVDASRVGVIGFCMGGFAALLAGRRLNVRTVVAFYGGGVVRERPGFGLTPFVDELSKMKAPVLAIFGGNDQSITPGDVASISQALEASGATHEVVVYPEGGHGFACDERASYDATSAAAAWKKTSEWLERTLGKRKG
jgi:carboxymethylenebutenolidase